MTSSLATFKVLISQCLNDGTVIDAKEFHRLQKYRSKNESPNGRKLSKNYHGRNTEFKKTTGTKIIGVSLCVLFNPPMVKPFQLTYLAKRGEGVVSTPPS